MTQPVLPLVIIGVLILGITTTVVVSRMSSGQHEWRPGCALTVAALQRQLIDEGLCGCHHIRVSDPDPDDTPDQDDPEVTP